MELGLDGPRTDYVDTQGHSELISYLYFQDTRIPGVDQQIT